MNKIILTNDAENNLKELISDLSKKADRIEIATAFFSETESIIEWLADSKEIDLLVSLRPPTNYYSLKLVQSKLGINIQFFGSEFHSKFFIFYTAGIPFASIIGSSNFTAGGLFKNIETNAILTDTVYLNELANHFSILWYKSYLLQPTDLEKFKHVFDNFQRRKNETNQEQNSFEKNILNNRKSIKKIIKIGKEAKQYFDFWRVVDEVKGLVNGISEEEFPNIPVYITIDHFWHWIKIIWSKENRQKPALTNRNIEIPKLFTEFCLWDKNNGNYTKQMAQTSRIIFKKLLSENHIDNLTKSEAQEVYANLHSGAMRSRRFGSDKIFVQDNSIQKIRNSFKYLLYSNDDLRLRIHNLIVNPNYKLNQFSSSGTQELIGWVNPENYPIRNDKADEALRLLGLN